MHCIDLETSDPHFALAVEEVLLKKRTSDYFLIYINQPSVIIGKHQPAHREINTKFITENNIPVLRRISGGGTVYHDEGNINFTFICNSSAGQQIDFRKYTEPVISYLRSLGVNAVLGDKNDIRIGEFKISGNAEHVHHERVLHHGTILFSSELGNLRNSIRTDKSAYTSKGVASNSASVRNLSDYLPVATDLQVFKSGLLAFIGDRFSPVIETKPDENLIDEANSLIATRYSRWEWNWGYGPEYVFRNNFIVGGNNISCTITVKDGVIENCKFDGDSDLESLAHALSGTRHMPDDISVLLKKYNVEIQGAGVFELF